MQDLTVIGVENGALLVSSDGGERFRIVIDDVLQSRLRQGVAAQTSGKKVSPREIQTHIRAGLSAFEVAELTGASVEYVERFEGPVVAERQFMVDSALRVPVQPTTPADPLGEEPLSTFGDALEERLEGLDAKDIRWASWKDETGWIVKLTFSSREIEHDARWQFDPKRHALTPLNNEATTLSRHGELSEGLIPRLRAVSTPAEGGDARFDSGSFSPLERVPATSAEPDAESSSDAATTDAPSSDPAPVTESAASASGSAGATSTAALFSAGRPAKEAQRPYDGFAVKRAPDTSDTADHNQTADLLEALRRRRGEREAAAFEPAHDEEPVFGGPRPVPIDPVDTPLEGLEAEIIVPPIPQSGSSAPSVSSGSSGKQPSAKRQRAAMPSWDEIVFGARSDDDPA
ncbi:septation protein SepH [Herbiconiux sp. CPCC 205763]|uniref:Septation protein SepH n=1 Tax=Herbiconiux aconitum TaxID=2970913 RepID=A0ABT2GTL1_9MICO|nr:septation protein SepH [Herbiconiux aconitum]MCS5719559.1 septation protein SepH [Herbiconiux aconitum]